MSIQKSIIHKELCNKNSENEIQKMNPFTKESNRTVKFDKWKTVFSKLQDILMKSKI